MLLRALLVWPALAALAGCGGKVEADAGAAKASGAPHAAVSARGAEVSTIGPRPASRTARPGASGAPPASIDPLEAPFVEEPSPP